jgi:hypothetical protein
MGRRRTRRSRNSDFNKNADNACPARVVLAFRMRYCTALLTLFITVASYAQRDKLSITLCPLAAADFISFQTIQGGVEYRFTPAFSWYNELGVEFISSYLDRPDSVILRPHGIKIKTEFRYFFHRGQYVAGNAFLISDAHNTGIEYAYNGYNDSLRSDAFVVRNTVWGLNAVYGLLSCFVFGKGQYIIIRVGDGEFSGAVEGLLETVDNVNFVVDGVKERPDVGDPDIKQQGTAVRSADLRQCIAKAFKCLEHEGDLAAGNHGPDELAFAFAGDGHDLPETEEFVEFDGRANIFYKEVGGKRIHF